MAVEQLNQYSPVRRLAWPAIAASLLLSACSTFQSGSEPAAPAQPMPTSAPAAPVVTPQVQAARHQLKAIARMQGRR